MLVPKDGEDELPFDELDPCCQREILEQKHRNEVSSKLRNVDRSNVRYDAHASVFCGVNGANLWSCHCCSSRKDYDTLLKLRLRMNAEEEAENEMNKDSDAGSGASDDDSDDELLDFDIPLTGFEKERMMEMELRVQKLHTAKAFGLAQHLEDSLDHCMFYIDQKSIPMVLHIFQPSSEQCAMIDWIIETNLCEQFPGTRFRRLEYNSLLIRDERITSRRWDSKISVNGSIICIRNGDIVTTTSNLDQLGEEETDIRNNLRRFLDQAHVLESDIPPVSLLQLSSASLPSEEADDQRDDARYCDDPDCTKKYQHEHVAKRDADGKLLTGASFLTTSQQRGMEAFAPNALSRV